MPVHNVTKEFLMERKGRRKKKQVVLGQSIGYPFKPEHSTGRFSKCQSHFWLWTDSLMDHSTESVGGQWRRRRRKGWRPKTNIKEKMVYASFFFFSLSASKASAVEEANA